MIIKSKTFLSNTVKSGQKSRVIAEIYVDEASELPAYNSNPDFDFVQGSIAYVIKSGEFYVMGSDNQWYDTDGNSAEVI
ncbi:MAG: hypothetical protein K2N27_12735 [Ruminococcus sp.]|nr:hypothetical protein [Ruminococcus sp.]